MSCEGCESIVGIYLPDNPLTTVKWWENLCETGWSHLVGYELYFDGQPTGLKLTTLDIDCTSGVCGEIDGKCVEIDPCAPKVTMTWNLDPGSWMNNLPGLRWRNRFNIKPGGGMHPETDLLIGAPGTYDHPCPDCVGIPDGWMLWHFELVDDDNNRYALMMIDLACGKCEDDGTAPPV